METSVIEAVARIQCDIGLENVVVRPVSFKGWAIVHPIDGNRAEEIFTAKTEQECYDLLNMAR